MNSASNSQDIILGDLPCPDLLDSSGYFPDGGSTDDEESCDDRSVDLGDNGDVYDDEKARISTPISLLGDSEFLIPEPNLSGNLLPLLPPPVDKNAATESIATARISGSIADEYIWRNNAVYISFNLETGGEGIGILKLPAEVVKVLHSTHEIVNEKEVFNEYVISEK